MNFTAKIIRLVDTDLPRIGSTIGVGEDPIHAFLDVETAGGGYDTKGRVKILYEPHRAYKSASKVSTALRDRLVKAKLAYVNWGAQPYPSDSYPRLIAASAIDETVALKSCSWGIGQVLGENFKVAGYRSPQEMVQAYVEGGEAEQLESAMRFIKGNGLDKHLRAIEAKIHAGKLVTKADATPFAEGYNGAAQAKHGYAQMIADRANWWAKRPDTPWSPQEVPAGHLIALTLPLPEKSELASQPAPELKKGPQSVIREALNAGYDLVHRNLKG